MRLSGAAARTGDLREKTEIRSIIIRKQEVVLKKNHTNRITKK